MADYVDLVQLSKLIPEHIHNESIVKAAGNAAETASACILASDKLGTVVKNANGISVWFPAYGNLYYDYRAKYLALRCNEQNSGWVKFLDAYHC